MTEVTLANAEVLRVRPGESLIVHVREADVPQDMVDGLVEALVAAGIPEGRFLVLYGENIDLAVVEP